MPGVDVLTQVRTGASNPLRETAGTYFTTGITERGSAVEPVELRSMADYESKLGSRVTYGALYDDLRSFFEEGGARAYVGRVVGAAASVGTLTLVDRAGSPLNTVRIDAKDPGSWSSNVTIQVANGIVTNSVDITVRYSGVGAVSVETFRNLLTPSDIVAALAKSSYVRAVDLASATASPNNRPAVLAATALSAGADNRGSVVAADYVTAFGRFGAEYGTGQVGIPGQAASAVGAGLIAHAKAYRRLAFFAPVVDASDSAAITEAAALRTIDGSEHAGMFHSWVNIPDDAGGLRKISPVGAIAGLYARGIETSGPGTAPAGEMGKFRFVLSAAADITRTKGDTLNDGEVNAIRTVGGVLRLYGWRSLSVDEENWYHLSDRALINYIADECERRLEQYTFRTIDPSGHLFAEMKNTCLGVVKPLAEAGRLYDRKDGAGDQIDPGFRVDTGSTVNSPETIAQRKARVAVSVRCSPLGELVQVVISKAGQSVGL